MYQTAEADPQLLVYKELGDELKAGEEEWKKANNVNLVRLAEFLMLSIYYDGSKEKSIQYSYRTSPDLCYDELW